MAKDSIRVVIRQPLHPLLEEWSKALGIEDFGEIVNFLLLDLKRNGYSPSPQLVVTNNQLKPTPELSVPTDVNDLAGLF